MNPGEAHRDWIAVMRILATTVLAAAIGKFNCCYIIVITLLVGIVNQIKDNWFYIREKNKSTSSKIKWLYNFNYIKDLTVSNLIFYKFYY